MPPEADTPEATDAPEATTETNDAPQLSPEDLKRELDKTRKEAAKYRTKLKERDDAEAKAAEEKRKNEQTAEERAKEAERKAQEAVAAAEARVQAAERKAALAGKVSNPDRVLKLMDDAEAFFDGTDPKVDEILKAFPEYAPASTGTGAAPIDGAKPRPAGKSDPGDLASAIKQHYKI